MAVQPFMTVQLLAPAGSVYLAAAIAVLVTLAAGIFTWRHRSKKQKQKPAPGGVESNYVQSLLNDPLAKEHVIRAAEEGWTARPGWTRIDVEYGSAGGSLPYSHSGKDPRYRPEATLPLVLRLAEWNKHFKHAAQNGWKGTAPANELLLMDLIQAVSQLYSLMDDALTSEASSKD